MIYIIAILILLIILVVSIIFSDITIHVIFRRGAGFQKSRIKILFLNRFILFDKKFESSKESDESERREKPSKIDKYSEIVIKSLGTMGRYNDFLRDINISLGNGLKAAKLNFSTSIGAEDAAVTGILCGIAWAILGNLRMQKDYYSLFKNVEFSVKPDYKKKIFTVDVDSIFTIKTVYIIYVLVSLNQLFNLEKKRTEG